MRGAVVALMLAAQLIQPQCTPGDTATNPPPAPAPAPTPAPTPTPAPAPSAEVFTTRDGVRFTVATIATGLVVPWSLAFAPDGRLFVTERLGRVRIFDASLSTSAVALTMDDVHAESEAGLLGLALDPDFAQNRLVYAYYTARGSNGILNRVVRYRESAGSLIERVVILDNIPGAGIHDGGRLRFGPDGLLYITAGDAANTSLAQDASSYAGKILRLNRDGTTPRTNPFSSPIFTLGHRNPQGLDWHPVTGDLWENEHGNSGNDEVNVLDAGRNYGWPRIEGSLTMAGMETPLASFSPAIAPSGSSFYRGSRFPRFANNYFVAALRGMHLLRVQIDAASPRRIAGTERLLDGRFGRLRDVVAGPDGLLYVCTNNRDGRGAATAGDDRILRLEPAS